MKNEKHYCEVIYFNHFLVLRKIIQVCKLRMTFTTQSTLHEHLLRKRTWLSLHWESSDPMLPKPMSLCPVYYDPDTVYSDSVYCDPVYSDPVCFVELCGR